MMEFTNLDNLKVQRLAVTGQENIICKKLSSVTYNTIATSGAAVKVGSLPAGAILLGAVCDVKTVFNGTDFAIQLGTGAASGVTTDWLGASDITEATAGAYGKSVFSKGAADIFYEATFTAKGTTGAADFYIWYVE